MAKRFFCRLEAGEARDRVLTVISAATTPCHYLVAKNPHHLYQFSSDNVHHECSTRSSVLSAFYSNACELLPYVQLVPTERFSYHVPSSRLIAKSFFTNQTGNTRQSVNMIGITMKLYT